MKASRRILVAGAALLIAAAGDLSRAQEVGTASAVNPAATANLRTISIGSSIEHKERIRTTSAGSVQLLFVDKTSMTIGPNSDLVIDEYVYDPNAGTGRLAATLGKGALRFVGGQVSHTGDAEIKTANSVIGIRGGVALITSDNVYAGYGRLSVATGGGSVTLYPGEFTQTLGGAPPTPPGPPPAGFVGAQLALFQSTGGQSGGAKPGAASERAVRGAEARATGSSDGTVAQVGLNRTVNPSSLPGSSLLDAITGAVQTTTQNNVAGQTAGRLPPPAPPPPPIVVTAPPPPPPPIPITTPPPPPVIQ
jgi:FecR protein